ncbi:hypothetical protein J4446_00765 [Candidatus Woesearchaeota archaeon]|nr:hypothetical protein [Candidatus Woesearchaeota archaeon]
MDKERIFIIKFLLDKGNIKTQIHTKNISPQEAIGLLETAKDQILENVRKGRKEIFKSSKKDE